MKWKEEVIQSVNAGIMVVDSSFSFLFANKAINSIGLSHQSIIGRNVFDIFPNLSRENSTFAHVIRTGEEIVNKPQSFVTYRGELKRTLTSTYPIKEGNKIVGAFEIFQDYSELQDVKDKLVEFQKSASKEYNTSNVDQNKNEFKTFIGNDDSILNIKKQIKLFANTQSPIFIFGETGTGKEVIVQNIHYQGSHRVPLITQNCAAIPDNLLESYLFGTVRGSFTGAMDKEGLFEVANGGILFLDEINSLSMNLQAKLLRVIQDQKIRRVGGTKEIPVNVRIIVATNVHPKILLKNKEMREDLFYRLNVLYLEVPPLRKRKQDIPILIDHFIEEYNMKMDRNVKGLTKEAMEYLMNHSWPGNVRELKNIIERFMNLVQDNLVDKGDIEFSDFLQVSPPKPLGEKREKDNLQIKFNEEVERLERKIILEGLKESKGNISKAARLLDLPQQTLSNKIKKYNFKKEIYQIKLLENG